MAKYTDPLQLYDRNLVIKSVIDIYESFVWTDVYCGCGDFEVKIPCEIAKRYNIDIGDLLMCSLSKKMMIIETVNIEYDSDNSVMVTYKGRSLESILYRRVLRKEDVPNIVPQYSSQNEKYNPAVTRGLQQSIVYVLGKTIVQGAYLTHVSRGIDIFGYTASTDPEITSLTAPYTEIDGLTVYDYIKSVLDYYGLGFKVDFNLSGTAGGNVGSRKMLFSIYKGKNRGYTQALNERVIFAPDDDSTFKMDTEIDISNYGNAAIILGPNVSVQDGYDEEGNPIVVNTNKRYTTQLYSGVSGLDRYEIYVDATDLNPTDENNNIYPESYIIAQMRFKAIQEVKSRLSGNISCSPQVDFDPYKTYGVDYDLGDVVTVMDDFGNVNIVRISAFTHSVDSSGIQAYPTFESISPIGGYRVIEQKVNGEDAARELERESDVENVIRVTEHNNLELFDYTEIE